ncbi:MAG TPA: substrate-binding domain-containing protein [Conexibacter sp.]|jgi:ribose transport system substrate-binding protein
MKRVLAALAAVALASGLAACGSSSDDSSASGSSSSSDSSTTASSGGKDYTIGVANFTLGAPYFIAMSRAIQDEGSRAGVDVKVTDAGSDATKLTTDVQNLIDQKVDGIVISGGPLEAAPAALNAAKQANIPVVMVDRRLKGGDYASWIGPDNLAIGRQAGEYIERRLSGDGTVGIIKGGPADNTIGLDRTNGMLSVLRADPGIRTVAAPDFGNWATDGGVQVAENMLAKNDDIDAIFCENDAMCLGAQKAARDAGRSDDLFLVSADGQKEVLKAILDGTNYGATGANDANKIGRMGYQRLVDILGGQQAEKDTVVPAPEITKDNVEQYYDPNSLF